jgi:hypothetical protein
MDLRHDNVTLADTGVPGGATIDQLASTAKNLAAGIRNKAKAKKAQKTADAGNYWTLEQFLKGLIPIPQYIYDQVKNQGISEYAVLQIPAQGVGTSNANIINLLKQYTTAAPDPTTGASTLALRGSMIGTIPAGTTVAGTTLTQSAKGGTSGTPISAAGVIPSTSFSKYLPIILVIGAGVLIFFIVKRKK